MTNTFHNIPYPLSSQTAVTCTCMIPFQLRAMWTPDRSLRLCIYMYPYVDHNTVRLQIFIDKNSSTLRTPYREQSVPNRPTDLLLSVRHRLSKSYFLSSWLILQTFRKDRTEALNPVFMSIVTSDVFEK